MASVTGSAKTPCLSFTRSLFTRSSIVADLGGGSTNVGTDTPPETPPACAWLASVVPIPSDAPSESSPAAGRFRFVCARAAGGAGDGPDDLGGSSSPHES